MRGPAGQSRMRGRAERLPPGGEQMARQPGMSGSPATSHAASAMHYVPAAVTS